MPKKLLALLLALAMLASSLLILTACKETPPEPPISDPPEEDPPSEDPPAEVDRRTRMKEGIIVPPKKDYGRKTVSFSEMKYERPDIAKLLSDIVKVTEKITGNDGSYEEQLAAVEALDEGISHYTSMRALANVYTSINSSDDFFPAEYAYIKTNAPSVSQKIDDLCVAAANSPYAERFEDDYFGEGLIEEYKDGGIYTDALVALLSKEADLETAYETLSTATVKILFNGEETTYDAVVERFRSAYGESSTEYLSAEARAAALYRDAANERSAEILVDLVKIRREIADELGDPTYAVFAYDAMGHDYSAEKCEKFISDVREYVMPVYSLLDYLVFTPYFNATAESTAATREVVNRLYALFGNLDEDLSDIFSFMLTYDLYDLDAEEPNREEGAFTTNIDEYEAPFIFATFDGKISDYMTLSHEFGHFSDMYLNPEVEKSLDLDEVSSQGLELLSMLALDGVLPEEDARYLLYKELSGALEILVFQGFYAKFEELIYKLPYDEITRENLDACVAEAADFFGFNSTVLCDLTYVIIPHIMLYPYYVQSYCTSITAALEIYFLEKETAGAGLDTYLALLTEDVEGLTFEEALAGAGIPSPFEEDLLRDLADKIYFSIVGGHYYKVTGENKNAA